MNWIIRNWLILAAVLAAMTALGSILDVADTAGLIIAAGWAVVGALALVDGVRRVIGQPSLLGPGNGFGRVLAIVQILLALILLAGLITPLL
ncbi:MAG: hypothetical protein ACOX87_14405 [Chloroflexota bacterium]|jgi:hypothetical protein